MRYCQACGSYHDDSAAFCSSCGAPLQAVVQPPSQNQPPLNQNRYPQGHQMPYGGAPYSGQPGYQPNVHGTPQPGRQRGMPPKKPNRVPLILAVVAGALAVVVLAYAMVWVLTGSRRDTSSVPVSISSLPEKNLSQPSSVSSSIPLAAEGYSWVIEPKFTYQAIRPIYGAYINPDSFGYVVIQEGNLVSVARFDEKLEPLFPFYSGDGLYLCSSGFAHGFPSDIENQDVDTANSMIQKAGFSISTDGAHGGYDPLVYLYNPDTGAMDMGFLGYDGVYIPEEPVPANYIPSYLRVVSLADFDAEGYPGESLRYGLATQAGEMLLPIEYSSIDNMAGEVAILEQDGLYGYYHMAERRIITGCEWAPVWGTDTQYRQMPGFHNSGFCPVVKNGRYGFMDLQGKITVKPEFEGVSHVSNRYAYVKKDGLWGMIRID